MKKSGMSKTKKLHIANPRFRILNLAVALIATMTVGLALLAIGSASDIYAIPDSIVSKPTCDKNMPDVSNEIYEWLKTVPNGTTAQLKKDQCYRTESEVPIRSKTNFIFDGNGAKLQAFTDGCDSQDPNPNDDNNSFDYCKYIQTYPSCHPAGDNCARPSWPQQRKRLELEANKNLIIKNIKLDGGHPNPGPDGTYRGALAFQHGINFVKNNDTVVVDGIEIDRVWGDYVYIGGENEKNITIQNSKFGEMAGSDKHGNGRQGIAMVDGQNIIIKNNRIIGVRRTVVDIEPLSSRAVIKNFYFDDNYVGDHRLNFFSNRNYGDADPVIENVYFRNNTHAASRFSIDSVAYTATIKPDDPSTFKRRNYQFINNRSTGSNASGSCSDPGSYMKLWGIDGVVIKNTNSRVNSGRCMTLVNGNKLRNVTVTGNTTLNALRTAGKYENSINVCERDNYVGNPLTPDAINAAAKQCLPDEPPPPADTTPPTKPEALQTTVNEQKQVQLTWQAATDDKGIKEYRVYRKPAFTTNFARIGVTTNINYSDVTAVPGRTYVYQVSAVDETGNESTKSDPANASIPAPPSFDDADINEDGRVNLLDFSQLNTKFGQRESLGRTDINKDGIVNLLDFSILSSRFGS